MTEAANEALARRFYEELNARNLDAFDEFMAADIIDHNPPPRQGPGLAGIKATMAMYISAFSDAKAEIELVIAKGDYVTIYYTGSGTHDGVFMGNADTGKHASIPIIDIWRVKDGKLDETWHVEDLLRLLSQIGARFSVP